VEIADEHKKRLARWVYYSEKLDCDWVKKQSIHWRSNSRSSQLEYEKILQNVCSLERKVFDSWYFQYSNLTGESHMPDCQLGYYSAATSILCLLTFTSLLLCIVNMYFVHIQLFYIMSIERNNYTLHIMFVFVI